MMLMLMMKSGTCDIALDSAGSQLDMCILLSSMDSYVLHLLTSGKQPLKESFFNKQKTKIFHRTCWV